VAEALPGGICPVCGKQGIRVARGIEVGNIFQLGTRYSELMGMTYDDEKGQRVNPIMGCYGIGVGRLIASVCEAKHDAYGPLWPVSIAPWQVQICALRCDDENVRNASHKLYNDLQNAGVEVIYDDRPVSPGFMFSDADLIGSPVRVIISPKTLARGVFEIITRDKTIKSDVEPGYAIVFIAELIDKLKHDIDLTVPAAI
jgi:prolyl-tRNA synthetase